MKWWIPEYKWDLFEVQVGIASDWRKNMLFLKLNPKKGSNVFVVDLICYMKKDKSFCFVFCFFFSAKDWGMITCNLVNETFFRKVIFIQPALIFLILPFYSIERCGRKWFYSIINILLLLMPKKTLRQYLRNLAKLTPEWCF